MGELTSLALRLLELYGPLALLAFTFLETSMLFPFLPSEVVVPFAAALLVGDPVSFVVFVVAAGVGGTVGAFVPFYVFRGTQARGVRWIRKRLDVPETTVRRGQEWFRTWGRSAVFWGRFLPAIRSIVSIPAGIARMSPLRFGAYTAIGTVGFYAAVGGLVYYGRQQSLFETMYAVAIERPVLTAVGLVVTVVVALVIGKGGRALDL